MDEFCCTLELACVNPVLRLADQTLSSRLSLSRLYSSSTAVSLLGQAVCHMAMTRAMFCRDLLILQKLYLHFGDNVCSALQEPLQKENGGLEEAFLVLHFFMLSLVCPGVSWRREPAAAAPAGSDPPDVPPSLLLSPTQTCQLQPGLLCCHGHNVSMSH